MACGRIGFDPIGHANGDAAIDPDLVLWYPFDVDPAPMVVDDAGNGHAGQCATTCPVLTAGVRGGAAMFDGVTDAIETPGVADLSLATGTIVFWVRIDALPMAGHFFSKAFGASIDSWEINVDVPGQLRFGGDSAGQQYIFGPTIAVGGWVQIAMTWGGGTFLGYLDGTPIEAAMPFTPAYDAGVVTVGANNVSGATTSRLPMTMDDLRVYRRALSPSELAML